MNILFITDNFPPEVNAPATRTYEHCKEWIKLGSNVTVITCVPNFPKGKVFSGYKNKFVQNENIDGIKVVRVWSYITANEGFFKRVVDYLSFSLSSFIAGLFLRADIIIATSPQFFTTWSAFMLSKIKRKPWIFELRDLWPETIKAVGAVKQTKILQLLEKNELFLYRESNIVIALTEAFKKNLISRGIDAEKIKVVTNGSNLELFHCRGKNIKLLNELKLQNKFIVGYIGTHGMCHGLEFIANTISKISDSDIHFLFVGDGVKKEAVVKLANQKNLKNVTFLPPVRKELVPDYMSITDVALVPLLKSETFKSVIPSKIFEAAAMKKPILLGVDGQAREIVEKYSAGICYEPENEKDFLDKINLIKNDGNLYKRLQEGCTKLAYDFDRTKLAKTMLAYLKEAIKIP